MTSLRYLHHKANTKGFTLVEVLVALFIFAWMGLAAYRILDQIASTQAAQEKFSDSLALRQKLQWWMARDFRQLIDRPIRDKYGSVIESLTTETPLYTVEFTRSGWNNPLQLQRSELQRVAYAVDIHPEANNSNSIYYNSDEQYLLRYYWNVLDQADNTEPFVQVLLENVTDFNVSFFEKETEQWIEQWPSTSSKSASSEPATSAGTMALPDAVALEIRLDNDESMSFFYRVK